MCLWPWLQRWWLQLWGHERMLRGPCSLRKWHLHQPTGSVGSIFNFVFLLNITYFEGILYLWLSNGLHASKSDQHPNVYWHRRMCYVGQCLHEWLMRELGWAIPVSTLPSTCMHIEFDLSTLVHVHRCICDPGFTLDSSGANCTDVNECEDRLACQYGECINNEVNLCCLWNCSPTLHDLVYCREAMNALVHPTLIWSSPEMDALIGGKSIAIWISTTPWLVRKTQTRIQSPIKAHCVTFSQLIEHVDPLSV